VQQRLTSNPEKKPPASFPGTVGQPVMSAASAANSTQLCFSQRLARREKRCFRAPLVLQFPE